MRRILECYKGKKVLVTGHTGFKGAWLSIWLDYLGAEVIGFSLDPIVHPNLYELSALSGLVNDLRGDIRDKTSISKAIQTYKPEIIFHLAAQPLVLASYNEPLYTFETNTLGTANLLEAIRQSNSVHTAVMITTDKVYDNQEWVWGYRENDPKGGFDPYSSSKGAAELIISSYRNSFFNVKEHQKHGKAISSARAGNVIGGGDWAADRLVPDCIRAIENNYKIKIRNPNSKRPWQHVLEPLGGYLLLAIKMMENPVQYSSEWNFGPNLCNILTVYTLVNEIVQRYGKGSIEEDSVIESLHEAQLLSLDISKAYFTLGWMPQLSFHETVDLTVHWYKNYKHMDLKEMCLDQVQFYINKWK